MATNSITKRFLMGTFWIFVSTLGLSGVAHAQDLQAELDALDDLPEEDLFGGGNSGGNAGKSAGSAKKSAESEEALSFEDSELSAGGRKNEARTSGARGTSDPDLQGLEEELKFDDYQDGNALSLDELNNDPSLKASTVDGPMGAMTALDFKQLGDRVRIVVAANRPIDWTRELRGKRRQVVVELRNMKIKNELLRRPLDTGEFEGPVAVVQAFESSSANVPTVKILIQLRNFVDPTILRTGNQLVVDFPLVSQDSIFRSSAKARAVAPQTFLSMSDIKEFKGEIIPSINARETPLAEIVSFLLRDKGVNFIFKDGSGATPVTVSLKSIPWDQALATILFNARPAPVGYQIIDKVYYFSTVAALQTELRDLAAAQANSQVLAPVETRLIPVAYYDLSGMQTQIRAFSTPTRGTIALDTPSNTLIVTDTTEVLDKMEKLVRILDRQPAQILIEGRLVSMSRNGTRSLGIPWNVGGIERGGITSNIRVGNGGPLAAVTQTAGTASGELNIPLRVGNLGPFGAVSATLSLLGGRSLSKTLSSPRVVTQNGLAATISDSISVQQASGFTTTGQAALTTIQLPSSLSVTPVVKADGFLDLVVNITKGSLTSGGGTKTQTVSNRVLVEDGKTVVIGGISNLDDNYTETHVPFFNALPIFGALFKDTRAWVEGSAELMAFISPKILNPNESRGYAWDTLQKSRKGENSPDESLSVFGADDETTPSAGGTF